jgi:hypothetical protein
MTVLAVSTGVVVIVVVIGIVATALIVAVAMRGRDKSRRAERRDLDDVHERAGRADRDTAQGIGEDLDR